MPAESAHALMAGFLVRMGGIMDYAEMKKSQLIEEIKALQQKIGELEHVEARRKPTEGARDEE
jgi:hypothetical protein